ncbi:hypothetical protein R3P38DRAFT_2902903 [Favolaschia claudopus]|uniref:Uncharacterized protein n=1 Tax=Favolaschia claudopus TaxID=2862362 RepID=A0AAW0CMD8_9AGAR
MRFPFPSRARLKYKKGAAAFADTSSDVLRTSLNALKESAEGFPPLKGAVGGVIAVWDVAERAKHSKAEALRIARRTQTILGEIAGAVPDPTTIDPPILDSILRFTDLVYEIRRDIEVVVKAKRLTRLTHLNRHERMLTDMRDRLEIAYNDFGVACTLRTAMAHHCTSRNISSIQAKVNGISSVLVSGISHLST